MAQVGQLRVGPWVPTYEPTAEHGVHRLHPDATVADGPPDWRPHTVQYPDDDARRRYRGYRRGAPPARGPPPARGAPPHPAAGGGNPPARPREGGGGGPNEGPQRPAVHHPPPPAPPPQKLVGLQFQQTPPPGRADDPGEARPPRRW